MRGSVVVRIDAEWLSGSGAPVEAGTCALSDYHVILEQVGMLLNSEIDTADLPVERAVQISWGGLEAGDHYLTIWTNYDNPNCCLTGTISVTSS